MMPGDPWRGLTPRLNLLAERLEQGLTPTITDRRALSVIAALARNAEKPKRRRGPNG